jgi:hypothetical protein
MWQVTQMKIEQRKWTNDNGWVVLDPITFEVAPQLVLAFGSTTVLSDAQRFEEIKGLYPDSHIVTATTAGEILGTEVSDGTIALSAILFEKTTLQFCQTDVAESSQSYEAGKTLGQQLPQEGLVHVMVLSDGLKVNGTSLVHGLTESLPSNVSITGGLVGDGSDFKKTLTGLDSAPVEGKAVAIGFYGDSLHVGYGSFGGWDDFGPERLITKSKENVLYEIDGVPALGLYKEYLGDKANELPSSGLLFPMSLRMKNPDDSEVNVVRTVLAVDEAAQSVTFAGDMPEGAYAKLMKANFDRLIDGAAGAASMSTESFASMKPELAILISCVGRKLVLKDRIEEETEAVQTTIGEQAAMIGFYSYGELCPTAATEKQCQLHNQTMTITAFKEV